MYMSGALSVLILSFLCTACPAGFGHLYIARIKESSSNIRTHPTGYFKHESKRPFVDRVLPPGGSLVVAMTLLFLLIPFVPPE